MSCQFFTSIYSVASQSRQQRVLHQRVRLLLLLKDGSGCIELLCLVSTRGPSCVAVLVWCSTYILLLGARSIPDIEVSHLDPASSSH